MTETSGFYTTSGTPSGHQVTSYTQTIAAKAWAILASCGGKEGVAPSYLNELVGSVPGANTARIDTGGAIVDGQWYENNAAVDVTIPSAVGAGNTRIDRIVLRITWASFQCVITRIAGTDAASPVAPGITQTPGTTYDITLYQALVNTSGAVTLTDERVWAIVDVDGSTIENNAGELRVKDSGITPTQIANRTRKFVVPPMRRRYTTATDEFYVTGGIMLNNEAEAENSFYGFFVVPQDFVSGMTFKVLVNSVASGNIYAIRNAVYAQPGESYNAHQYNGSYTAVALTPDVLTAIFDTSLSSAAAGDIVALEFARDSNHASDTITNTVYLLGFLVEYTADS